MTSKHTPGSWHVGKVGKYVPNRVYNDNGWLVAITLNYEASTINYEERPPYPELYEIQKANARLIAAAPDMMDVLKRLRALMDGKSSVGSSIRYCDRELYDDIQDAIAKAEGRDT